MIVMFTILSTLFQPSVFHPPIPKEVEMKVRTFLEGFLVSVVSVINSFQVFQWFLDFRSFWVLVGSLVTGVLEMLLLFLKPSPL